MPEKRNKPLSAEDSKRNDEIAVIRAGGERPFARVSDLLCMSDLVHASKLKEHDDNDDIQRATGRAA